PTPRPPEGGFKGLQHFYWCWFLCFDDVFADGVSDQLRNGPKAQLSHDCRAVSLKSLHADSEGAVGLLHGFSRSEQLNDFTLAVRQWAAFVRTSMRLQEAIE